MSGSRVCRLDLVNDHIPIAEARNLALDPSKTVALVVLGDVEHLAEHSVAAHPTRPDQRRGGVLVRTVGAFYERLSSGLL